MQSQVSLPCAAEWLLEVHFVRRTTPLSAFIESMALRILATSLGLELADRRREVLHQKDGRGDADPCLSGVN